MNTTYHHGCCLLEDDDCEHRDLHAVRQADFYDVISKKLPVGWQVEDCDIWLHCRAAEHVPADQGWKIYVSAARLEAQGILDCVSDVLFASGDIAFKVAKDVYALSRVNGKNYPRGDAGKFITIYPKDKAGFLDVIEQLHLATREFQGPHILSGYRYKDSNVIFYRYGSMTRRRVLEITGERSPVLVRPDGGKLLDRPVACPATPSWVDPVLPLPTTSDHIENVYQLRNGRFQIEGVIKFSNAGGVYRAIDHHTDMPVIIKEARPWIEMPCGSDAIAVLKKEHRLLTLLADTGIAPCPVDLFYEGGHWFLVEEYIKGISLSKYSASHNVLLRTRPSEDDFQLWYTSFQKLARHLLKSVQILQSRNIVFSDLSTRNIILTDDENNLKLIDFEGARQRGIDQPTSPYIPGVSSQRKSRECGEGYKDEYYAAGAVLLAYLLPVNGFLHLNPTAIKTFLASILRDALFPDSAGQMILSLMEADATSRPVLDGLAETLPPACAAPQAAKPESVDYAEILEGTTTHLLQAADYSRPDHLFPADPRVFSTNGLSVAYGASGIAYALKKVTGSVPQSVIDWILAHSVECDAYPPGLYVGISGIAWALLECGQSAPAEKLFQLTFRHPLLGHSFDLFHGSAGWGLTCLRFFLETGNPVYLLKARQCASSLLEGSFEEWSSGHDRPLGLAHGASGIALFLLYLYILTREEQFLAMGKNALDSELAAGFDTPDGGLAWSSKFTSRSPVYPYWRHGSTGIGSVVVRYNQVLGGNLYAQVLEKIFIDADRKYAVLPGFFMGLAGIGQFLLDAWELTGQHRFLESAHRVGQSITNFRVERNGIAFPGENLKQLSCDYGTGSAGIALFFNRLQGQQGADFLLDDLLGIYQGRPRTSFASAATEIPAMTDKNSWSSPWNQPSRSRLSMGPG